MQQICALHFALYVGRILMGMLAYTLCGAIAAILVTLAAFALLTTMLVALSVPVTPNQSTLENFHVIAALLGGYAGQGVYTLRQFDRK